MMMVVIVIITATVSMIRNGVVASIVAVRYLQGGDRDVIFLIAG
jgi:hypothetical protein